VIIPPRSARGAQIVYAKTLLDGVLRNFFTGWCYILSLLDSKVRNTCSRFYTSPGSEKGIPRKHAFFRTGIEGAGIGDPRVRARRVPSPVFVYAFSRPLSNNGSSYLLYCIEGKVRNSPTSIPGVAGKARADRVGPVGGLSLEGKAA
jgi:hypothetical protein